MVENPTSKFALSPAQVAALLHVGRLALWGALSAVLTYGILPFLSNWLPGLHVTNPSLQALILLVTPVVLETVAHYRDVVNQLLQQEEQAKVIASLQAQVAVMKAVVDAHDVPCQPQLKDAKPSVLITPPRTSAQSSNQIQRGNDLSGL